MALRLPQIATSMMLVQNRAPQHVHAYLQACGLALDFKQNTTLVDALLDVVGPVMVQRGQARLKNMPAGGKPHVARVHQDNLNKTMFPDLNKGVVSHVLDVPEEKLAGIHQRVMLARSSTASLTSCTCTNCGASGRCGCLNSGQGCHAATCSRCSCEQKPRGNKVLQWYATALQALSPGKGSDKAKDDLFCQTDVAKKVGFNVAAIKRGTGSKHLNYEQLNVQFALGKKLDLHERNVQDETDVLWLDIDSVCPGSVAAEGKRDADAQIAVLRGAPVLFWKNAIDLCLELDQRKARGDMKALNQWAPREQNLEALKSIKQIATIFEVNLAHCETLADVTRADYEKIMFEAGEAVGPRRHDDTEEARLVHLRTQVVRLGSSLDTLIDDAPRVLDVLWAAAKGGRGAPLAFASLLQHGSRFPLVMRDSPPTLAQVRSLRGAENVEQVCRPCPR